MDQIFRRTARLVVVDPEGCVLLFQYQDDGRRWWATPGGGLEGDETFEDAAAREAGEELALALTTFVPVWGLTVTFAFRGRSINQVERYFLVRASREDVRLGETVGEAHRLEGILATRWWPLAEIETTAEDVFPKDLCQRLRELQSGFDIRTS